MLNFRLYLRVAKRLALHPLKSIEVIASIVRINKIVQSDGTEVVFYDRFAMHSGFSEPVLDEFLRLGGNALSLVGDKNHPALKERKDGLQVFYIDRGFELFLRYIKVPLIITPASAFDPDAKNNYTKVAHIFHSPVSMHYVYGDDSFDNHDIFFTVGPHQTREFELLSVLRGWKNKSSFKAGYPKIDKLAHDYSSFQRPITNDRKGKIAFAPSWGEKNVLRSHGIAIINDLLTEGFEVVLRPHKHSFDYDMDVIDEIKVFFQSMDFEIDDDIGFDKIYSCDVLISDWSGIAYEFAFSTGRPVIFVDVAGGQKIQSVRNLEINLEPMEDVCRFEIGLVAKPDDVYKSVTDVFEKGVSKWSDTIVIARKKYLYNYGESAIVIASCLKNLTSK